MQFQLVCRSWERQATEQNAVRSIASNTKATWSSEAWIHFEIDLIFNNLEFSNTKTTNRLTAQPNQGKDSR